MQPSLLIGPETHRDIAELLRTGRHIVLSGVSSETARAMLMSHLLHFHASPALVVVEDQEQGEELRHWLSFFGTPATLLPPPLSESEVEPGLLHTILRFLDGERGVCILPKSAWGVALPEVTELKRTALTIERGAELHFTDFVERLLAMGYEHSDEPVLLPGQYHRTGELLEVFPLQSAGPLRLHLGFDILERIEEVRHDGTSHHHPTFTAYARSSVKMRPLEAQLTEHSLLIFDDLEDVALPETRGAFLQFTSFPEAMEHHVHLRYLSILKFYTLTDFLNDVRDKLTQEWSLIVVTRRSEELEAILREEHIPSLKHERRKGAVTIVPAAEGDLLPHSIQNPDLQCALLTDREIFTLRKSGKERSIQKLALDFLTSLSPGDYVVHMEHGIGRFEGMTQQTLDDTVHEYLELSYAEGDRLFIPVDQADKLSKYVHEEGQEVTLMRLGGGEWKKLTEKVRHETQEVAKELLALAAKRASAKGFTFPSTDSEILAFGEAFPYVPTAGQRKAFQDIARDMEDPHPMDRLVCGDVGFGKTEVAMRAAFTAVKAGRQVAVIAPITILADQHFRTFSERMGKFGIRIDMLSRFRTPKEQEETLRELKRGKIDIVVGTHRLLQPDVVFSNLGLLIVDEEQRFGVKQKERFKELRASVDILTLTATPIPRTLNLGLHKLRDITTITTPPPGRLPIITEVRKYSDALVRTAILHELSRQGQCFVLHNRVETIDAFAAKLSALVPEARFIVAHGQLRPSALEERILAFKDGGYDVLVSSTIIENGIDLPRANTLIVNEAEHFGLAQLYQLRGRVGRSKLQAYAYLLYHSQKLHEDAKKRLRAIVEACELGSGFQVAMRDLEIRGAGEILGTEQSGTMQTVGISHYLRMLKAAVEELKAGSKASHEEEITNVEVLLPVEALIPSFYIPDSGEKISVYQKLAGCEDEETLGEFESDLKDEFGEMPRQVKNLFAVLRLRLACRKAGIIRIKAESTGRNTHDIVMTLSPRVTAVEIMRLLSLNSGWKISSSLLKISEAALIAKAGSPDYLGELTTEVQALVPLKRERAKKG